MNPRRVKCRYCEWSRPVWWTTKEGKKRNGFDALSEHMPDFHAEEFSWLKDMSKASTSDALMDAKQIAGIGEGMR